MLREKKTQIRLVGLFIIFGVLLIIFPYSKYRNNDYFKLYSSEISCLPGIYRSENQLPFQTWHPFKNSKLKIPIYVNVNFNQFNSEIKHAVIIQHGNLRNANDYYCAAVNSLQSTSLSKEEKESTLIIATQFLINEDNCWDLGSNRMKIDVAVSMDCDLPIWDSEGWKDGLKPINANESEAIFSYDVFDMIINHLGDPIYFPNLEKIALFGFSAGGQTVLRYSMLPSFNLKNKKIKLKFIVGDVSSYLYFDKIRPFSNGSSGFGVPNPSWISDSWKVIS